MLSHILVPQLFAFLLVFCRMGSALMLMPGFAELYVPMRMRLLMAVFFSLLLTPVLDMLPPPPPTVIGTATLLVVEITTGIFMGAMCRMLISVVHIAGSIIAYESSLASALTVDIAGFSGQDTSLGNLLSMTSIVLLFATDLHHVMLRGLADSYSLFIPGHFLITGDLADHAAQNMNNAFKMAMQMASPNIVIGMMLYLGAGILSRLMPNMQIFFIMMSPQLLISFFILMVSFSAIMLWYMDFLKTSFSAFLMPS